MLAWTLPSLIRSISDIGELGKFGNVGYWNKAYMDEKENLELIEFYYNSNPNEKGYMKGMKELWMDRRFASTLTEKKLVTSASKL